MQRGRTWMPTVSLDSLLWGVAPVLPGGISKFLTLVTLQGTYASQLQRNHTVASEQTSVTSVSLGLMRIIVLGDRQTCLGPGFSWLEG